MQEVITEEQIEGVKVKNYAYPDNYIEHGSVEELEKIYHVDEETIENDLKDFLSEEMLV